MMAVESTPAQEAARDKLLVRLRIGIRWLTTSHTHLLETQELHTTQEEKFLEALDLWDCLDNMLRELYG